MAHGLDSKPASTETPPAGDRRRNPWDRRALTWRTFLRSGLKPRRRDGRRVGDHELPVDFHEPHLLRLAVALLLLSIADAFMTVTLMADGATEANPLLAFVLDEHPQLFAIVKLLLTGLGAVLLVTMARTKLFRLVRALRVFQALVAAYLVLVAYELWLVRTML